MIDVKDFKHYFLGDKIKNSVVAYEVHNNLADALNAQHHRYELLEQNLRVYGVHKSNELVVVSNKLTENL